MNRPQPVGQETEERSTSSKSTSSEAPCRRDCGRLSVFAIACLLLATACGSSADRRQEEAQLGSYNQDRVKVAKIQLILMYCGFELEHFDGLLGPDTRAAVKVFQRHRELPVTGYLGDATWAALIAVEARDGPFTVERIQHGLKNSGFDPGSIDGSAGQMTVDALWRFQQAKGMTASGKLDAKTWAALKDSMPG